MGLIEALDKLVEDERAGDDLRITICFGQARQITIDADLDLEVVLEIVSRLEMVEQSVV